MNPYSPPKAPLGDAEQLPRAARILRGVAIAGSAVVALTVIPLVLIAPGSTRLLVELMVYALCVFLFATVNILALATQLAPRLVFWGALLSNGSLLAFSAYLHFGLTGRNPELVLVFVIPAILNFAALWMLHRARAALAQN